MDMLLRRGASPDQANRDNWTPLMEAAEKNQPDAVRLLVAAGNLEIVKKLVEAGIPLVTENIVWRHPLTLSGGSGFQDIVDYLLAAGFPLDLRNSVDGSTAIMWAANGGQIRVVLSLLEAGADPSLRDNSGWTAIEAAEMAGHDNIAAILRDGA